MYARAQMPDAIYHKPAPNVADAYSAAVASDMHPALVVAVAEGTVGTEALVDDRQSYRVVERYCSVDRLAVVIAVAVVGLREILLAIRHWTRRQRH